MKAPEFQQLSIEVPTLVFDTAVAPAEGAHRFPAAAFDTALAAAASGFNAETLMSLARLAHDSHGHTVQVGVKVQRSTISLSSAFVVCGFWVSSIGFTYSTKRLLTEPAWSVPAPALITWIQAAVSCVFFAALAVVGDRWGKGPLARFGSVGRLPPLRHCCATNLDGGGAAGVLELAGPGGGVAKAESSACGGALLTASACFAAAVLLDNMCLQRVNVSFLSVARGLSLPFISGAGYLLLGCRPRWDLAMPILMCVCGFSFGARAQPPDRIMGTVYGAMASLVLALYAVVLEPVLRGGPHGLGRLDTWQLTFLTNRNAVWLLPPVVLLLERPALMAHLPQLRSTAFWEVAVLSSLLGALSAVFAAEQASLLSQRNWVASVTAQRAVQHALAFAIWGNTPKIFGEVGTAMVLGALAVYATARGTPVLVPQHVTSPEQVQAHLPSPDPALESASFWVNKEGVEMT